MKDSISASLNCFSFKYLFNQALYNGLISYELPEGLNKLFKLKQLDASRTETSRSIKSF